MLITRVSALVFACLTCPPAHTAPAASEFPIARREILRQSPAWYASAQARTLGERIVALQGSRGGWSNWSNEVGMTQLSAPIEEKNIAPQSLDDGASTTQIKILGRLLTAPATPALPKEQAERFRASFLRGFDYLLTAQYPNGGWPHRFPAQGYHAHITFNDNTTYNVIALLRAAVKREPAYAPLDDERRRRAAAAIEHTDGIGATEAIELLERFKREARPFFLGVGFHRPHTPFVAPRKYFEPYPLEEIVLPPLSTADRHRTPGAAYVSAQSEQDTATDARRREAIQAYYASTSFMDAQLGRVLAALERLGLHDNTLIVFTSDHGYHLADHGLWQKGSLFERSVRVPLIVAGPLVRSKGANARGVVELLDLYPTLAELCGLRAPAYLEGVSLVPVLTDPQREVKPAAFSQVKRRASGREGFSLRSGRWRYTEWDVDGGIVRQLFDEEADPAEATDLVGRPEHAARIADFHRLIAAQRHGAARPQPK